MKQYFAKAEELFQHLLAGFVAVSFWKQKTDSSNSPLNERAFCLFFIGHCCWTAITLMYPEVRERTAQVCQGGDGKA